MARTYQHLESTDQPTHAPLLRWSSVFGGVVIGGALLLLLTTLWLALATATDVQAIADGLGWFIAGSAIVALFVGGWLAASLSGVPGIGPGILHGLAVWGVILMLSALIGTPGVLNFAAQPGFDLPTLDPGQAMWPAFWSLLIGAVTAGIGGAIGGLTTRGEVMAVPAERGYTEERYRDDDDRGERVYDDRGERRYRDEREREGTVAGRDDRDYGEERGYREERGTREERGRYPDDRPPPAERTAPSERSYAERTGGVHRDPRTNDHGR